MKGMKTVISAFRTAFSAAFSVAARITPKAVGNGTPDTARSLWEMWIFCGKSEENCNKCNYYEIVVCHGLQCLYTSDIPPFPFQIIVKITFGHSVNVTTCVTA